MVFVLTDNQAPWTLGCYGSKEIRTPNIDRLAEEGLRFTQCYTGSTVCAPSRSVLMTGQHTGQRADTPDPTDLNEVEIQLL